MSTIKKAFQPIMVVLAAAVTAGTTTQETYDECLALTVAKVGAGGGKASNFHKDEAGVVVAVKCYYHKLWMDPRVAEFGNKASSASGLNSMCKDGVSKWTKAQAEAKKQSAAILDKVTAGELKPKNIPEEQERIAAEAATILPREDGYGFATLEECLADSAKRAEEA